MAAVVATTRRVTPLRLQVLPGDDEKAGGARKGKKESKRQRTLLKEKARKDLEKEEARLEETRAKEKIQSDKEAL